MTAEFIANVSTGIHAPVTKVRDALTNPKIIKQYMFGTNVVPDREVGSPIVWKGEWQGRWYEDRILKLEEGRILRYSHFSPLSDKPDVPENYHTVTIKLTENGEQTSVSLSQDNNATEEAREHSEKNWNMLLDGLKRLLEPSRPERSSLPDFCVRWHLRRTLQSLLWSGLPDLRWSSDFGCWGRRAWRWVAAVSSTELGLLFQ